MTRISIPVRTIGICVAWILAGLVAAAVLGGKTNLLTKTPFPKSPAVLEQKAQDVIQSLGYTDAAHRPRLRFSLRHRIPELRGEAGEARHLSGATGERAAAPDLFLVSPEPAIPGSGPDGQPRRRSFHGFPRQSAADSLRNGQLESGCAGPADRLQRRPSAGGRDAGPAAASRLECATDRGRPRHDPLHACRATLDTFGELRRPGGVDRLIRARTGGAVANRGRILARKAGEFQIDWPVVKARKDAASAAVDCRGCLRDDVSCSAF